MQNLQHFVDSWYGVLVLSNLTGSRKFSFPGKKRVYKRTESPLEKFWPKYHLNQEFLTQLRIYGTPTYRGKNTASFHLNPYRTLPNICDASFNYPKEKKKCESKWKVWTYTSGPAFVEWWRVWCGGWSRHLWCWDRLRFPSPVLGPSPPRLMALWQDANPLSQ